jgi:hypothetical protein
VLVPTVADLMVYYHYARATIGRTAIRFSRGAPDVTG